MELKLRSILRRKTELNLGFCSGGCFNKYVTELPEENKKSIFTAKKCHPVRAIRRDETWDSSRSSTISPINQRKWKGVSSVGRIDGSSLKISKLMTRLLRHEGYPREDVGAIEWRRLLSLFY